MRPLPKAFKDAEDAMSESVRKLNSLNDGLEKLFRMVNSGVKGVDAPDYINIINIPLRSLETYWQYRENYYYDLKNAEDSKIYFTQGENQLASVQKQIQERMRFFFEDMEKTQTPFPEVELLGTGEKINGRALCDKVIEEVKNYSDKFIELQALYNLLPSAKNNPVAR